MAISSFFAKVDETEREVTYAFGEDRDHPEDSLIIDKVALTAYPVSGARTMGFHATVRAILRRFRDLGHWPEHGYVAS